MTDISGQYMGTPLKRNTITEAQAEALRKEGAQAERERIAELVRSKQDEDGCPPKATCGDNDSLNKCGDCWSRFVLREGEKATEESE